MKEGAAQQFQLADRGAHHRRQLLLRLRHGRLRVCIIAIVILFC